jgi:hypothetical protein
MIKTNSRYKLLMFLLIKFSFLISTNSFADLTAIIYPNQFSTIVRNRLKLIENWDQIDYQRWVGSNLWANRLQDWQILNGVLECVVRTQDSPMPMRTVHTITREVLPESGEEFHLAVQVRGTVSHLQKGQCMMGFLVNAGNGWSDYRAEAIVQSYSGLGGGPLCVIDYAADQLTFRDNSNEQNVDGYPVLSNIGYIKGEQSISSSSGDILLVLRVNKDHLNRYTLMLTGWDVQTGSFLGAAILKNCFKKDIIGSFAIVSHPGKTGFREPVAFTDFRCWGSMLKYLPERELGPIVGTLYSLKKAILKMTVQFMPVAWHGKFLDRFPILDYLYKWYLWFWSFRDLTKDRPCICQIDDHDVYAGNVWDYRGELNLTGLNYEGGGYMMDPLFVQVVERTQCLHNPDAFGFTEAMKNSFSSYFGSLTYGGISFAILEDRKFKTPPPGKSFQTEDEILLGNPQHRFLDEWSADWTNAHVKVIISQSTYASNHTDWDDGY